MELYKYIESHDAWTIFDNCASFAAGAWKAAGQKPLKYSVLGIGYPPTLARSIKKQNGYKINAPIGDDTNIANRDASSSSNPSSSSFESSNVTGMSSASSSGSDPSSSVTNSLFDWGWY